jgi:hypothetical protein
MAATRKQTRAKQQQYRKPVIQKRRKLADVAEGDNIVISGNID